MAQISQNTISSTIALPPREEGTGHKQKMRSPELGRPPFWERPSRGPLGTRFDAPVLTDEQAYDVAGYIVSQNRPEKANIERDFPIRLQKPIDAPYGPYADGFPAEQHRFGPFGPIRAKVKELAAESRTASAGEPDNGSHQAEGAR
jgi:hypothetical protein